MTGLDYAGYLTGGKNPNLGERRRYQLRRAVRRIHSTGGGSGVSGAPHHAVQLLRDLNGPWLLYDNETDPYQQKNLVNDPAMRTLRETLDAQLTAKLKRNGDTFQSADYYLEKFGYADKVNARGTLPTTP